MQRATKSTQAAVCLEELASLGQMRVWSVIITIFGDAVAQRGGVVPAVALQPILDRLSIRPEAMRVALHRLVKEGWIKRLKQGRQSFYALSDKGRDAFLPATRRIYARGSDSAGPWHLTALPPLPEPERARIAKTLKEAGCFALSPSIFLGKPSSKVDRRALLVASAEIDALPEWAISSIAPQYLADDYRKLKAALDKLAGCEIADPLDAVALRILLIHQWRRCLLRHPDLPAHFLPKTWLGADCRVAVLREWERLSVLCNPWLDDMIGPRVARQD